MCSFIIALSYISKHSSQAQFNYTKMSKKNHNTTCTSEERTISSDASEGGGGMHKL